MLLGHYNVAKKPKPKTHKEKLKEKLVFSESTVFTSQYGSANMTRPLVVANGVVTQFTEGDGVVVPGVTSASGDILLSPANGSRVKLGPVSLPTTRITYSKTLAATGVGGTTYIVPAATIPSNQTIYVSVNGNDTTGDGTVNNPYATVGMAMVKTQYFFIDENATLTISIGDGRYIVDSQPQMRYSQSAHHLKVEGANKVVTNVTSVISSSGSAGNYSVVLQLSSTANSSLISANDYVVISNASSGTNPERLNGCFLVTAVPGANQITINSRNRVGVPSGAISANCDCLKTILSPGSSGGTMSVVPGSVLTIKDLVFTPNTTQDIGYAVIIQGATSTAIIEGSVGCESLNNGVNVSTGGTLIINGVFACGDVMNSLLVGHGGGTVRSNSANSIHINGGSGNGIHVCNGSLQIESFTISGVAGHGIFASSGGAVSVNGGKIAFTVMSGIYANGADIRVGSAGLICNSAGAGYSGIHLNASYLSSTAGASLITCSNAQHGVNCNHSSMADITSINSSLNSNFGVYASYNSFMNRTGATLSGNSGGANSPNLTTLGNFESYIV